MKKISLFFCFVILTSCSSSGFRMEEEMLADGTWKISFPKNKTCHKKEKPSLAMNDARKSFEKDEDVSFSSGEDKKKCINDYQVDFDARARELCPSPKFRVFGCWQGETNTFSSRELVTCYVKCGEQK